MKVLVTGANSEVGIAVSNRLLASGHSIVAYDLNGGKVPHDVRFVEGDVRNFTQLMAASTGCDAGVHLAARANDSSAAEIMSVNVIGAYQFLAAAKKANFRNAIIASSAPVHLEPSDRDCGCLLRTSIEDDHAYDLSKALQETIGRDYHAHGLPVLCVRFGHIVLGEQEKTLDGAKALEDETYCRGGWVALEDIAGACAAALAIEPSRDHFEVLNIVGARSARAHFRVADAEARLGFALQYDFAVYE